MSCGYSAFELLLGMWPSACCQRVDVLSQLLDSSLHLGFRNKQSSPTRRAQSENKKVNDHCRSSVNTLEVSEESMGVTDTLGPALLILMASCKTRNTFTSIRGRTGEYNSPVAHKNITKNQKKSQHSYSRRHRIYSSSRHYPVLGRYASSRTAVSVYGQMYISALLHPYSSSSLCLAQGWCVTHVLYGTVYRVPVPSIISNFKRGQG